MDSINTIIIGAGVVGLAVARRLAQDGHETLVLESEKAIGSVISARNSGIIHAGIYYPVGSLKARLCLAGRDMLYDYAAARGVDHKRSGKLIVATTDAQIPLLREWQTRGATNGVKNLQWLTPAEAKQLEPEVFCVAALHSPDTGMIDVHGYLLALLGDAEAAGAMLSLQTPVERIEIQEKGFLVSTGGAAPITIQCRQLINAAGLNAQAVARTMRGLDPALIPPQVLAKGNYFSLIGKAPFTMPIYPLPDFGSSGLHASGDLAGRTRFGPDVEWVDHIDYRVDPALQPKFERAIRSYWPGLPDNALQPDFAGIRPKLKRGGPHDVDFMLQDERDHGIKGLVNLFGIESPGLTASLALAEEVAGRLGL